MNALAVAGGRLNGRLVTAWAALVQDRGSVLPWGALAAVAAAAVGLTLLTHGEVSDETWGYWMFARVFSDTGTFVTSDRSPLYTLYLSPFLWLDYPGAVIAEHLISSLIIIGAITTFFRRYLGPTVALLAALLWLPFLQAAAPPVQGLALACSLLAMVLRRRETGGTGLAGSYALFGLAYLMRPSYLILIILFGAWDLFRLVRTRRTREMMASLRARPAIVWPVVPVIALLLWFSLAQSGHQWNNAYFASSQWYPLSNPKSLADAHFIQALNWSYIEDTYGSFEGRDWYFTNQELFDGAGDSLSALRANPGFVFRELAGNVKPALDTASKLMVVRNLPLYNYYGILLLLAVLYGAFRAATREPTTVIFIIGSVVILAASVSILPEIGRHYVPLVPILILSASWYGSRMKQFVTNGSPDLHRLLFWAGISGTALLTLYLVARTAADPLPASKAIFMAAAGYAITLTFIVVGRYRPADPTRRLQGIVTPVLGLWVAAVAVVLLSNGTQWRSLAVDALKDLRDGDVRVLESREVPSMKASLNILEPLIKDCNGVMTHEHKFVGAFMDFRLERVYDIMEIPPFGRLGDPAYDGLRPDRVDCVLVSEVLATAVGAGTNIQLRYQGYVEPYVRQLKGMGAVTYNIPAYGRAIVLSPTR